MTDRYDINWGHHRNSTPTLEPHFCREDECYGRNPVHGYRESEALTIIKNWHEDKIQDLEEQILMLLGEPTPTPMPPLPTPPTYVRARKHPGHKEYVCAHLVEVLIDGEPTDREFYQVNTVTGQGEEILGWDSGSREHMIVSEDFSLRWKPDMIKGMSRSELAEAVGHDNLLAVQEGVVPWVL